MTILNELEEDRKDNFKAEVRKNANNQTRHFVTHNGYQWTGVALNYYEMATVKEVLSQEGKE